MKSGRQVDGTASVPDFFTCSAHQSQRLTPHFVGTGHICLLAKRQVDNHFTSRHRPLAPVLNKSCTTFQDKFTEFPMFSGEINGLAVCLYFVKGMQAKRAVHTAFWSTSAPPPFHPPVCGHLVLTAGGHSCVRSPRSDGWWSLLCAVTSF